MSDRKMYLFSQLQGVKDAAPDEAAGVAVFVYKEAAAHVKAVKDDYAMLQADAKDVLAKALEDIGTTKVTTEHGMAFIPADGVTVSYDATALDALCKSSPELAAVLKPHRREHVRIGKLTVR